MSGKYFKLDDSYRDQRTFIPIFSVPPPTLLRDAKSTQAMPSAFSPFFLPCQLISHWKLVAPLAPQS